MVWVPGVACLGREGKQGVTSLHRCLLSTYSVLGQRARRNRVN